MCRLEAARCCNFMQCQIFCIDRTSLSSEPCWHATRAWIPRQWSEVLPLCLQAKTKELKNSLNTEFGQIHSLCLFVLNASKKPSLIKATLATLHAFLSWIPLGYIFESNLVEVLADAVPPGALQERRPAVPDRGEAPSPAIWP